MIKSGGDTQTFIAKFFDSYGDEVVGLDPYWTISCDFKDALNIECENNWIKIGIDDYQYIDEDFKIVLADKENQYVSDLLIRIESLL